MKHKTSKITKLEKNRFSILTDKLEECYICHRSPVDINEIFMGRNRLNSMKYGLCIPLCRFCHNKYHNDRTMQLYFMNLAYNVFIKLYSVEEFKDTFKYIKGLDIF